MKMENLCNETFPTPRSIELQIYVTISKSHWKFWVHKCGLNPHIHLFTITLQNPDIKYINLLVPFIYGRWWCCYCICYDKHECPEQQKCQTSDQHCQKIIDIAWLFTLQDAALCPHSAQRCNQSSIFQKLNTQRKIESAKKELLWIDQF